jgi:pathogenesis-related protein 1
MALAYACGADEGTASKGKGTSSNDGVTPSVKLAPWQREILDGHNAVRASEKARLSPLSWDASLARLAQDWADAIKTKPGCEPAHREAASRQVDGKQVGENIYWQGGAGEGAFRADGTRVTRAWASEKPSWDKSRKTCKSGALCGHWTQMVWRETTAVGCGRAICGNAEVWVCNYAPAGNYDGRNPY